MGSTRAPKVARIGRYPVTGVLGRGGIGEVLQVYDPDLGRAIAVKVLRDARDPIMRRAFAFEARVLGHLQHQYIVPVHELGTDDEGRPYFTMHRIDGRTLHDRLSELARAPQVDATDELLDAFAKLCSAVAYAHERGILHLDLKPANVMLGRYGQVQLVDWGLARLADADAINLEDKAGLRGFGPDDTAEAGEDVWMPGSHRVMGTPAYMPPEQASRPRAELDRRADIYALGAILYHVLCRLPPYLGEDSATLFAQLAAGPPLPPRLRAPDTIARYIPAALEAICLRAMARDPAQRYAAVDELRRDLDRYRECSPIAVSRRGPPLAVARFLARRGAAVAASLIVLALVGEVYRARRALAVAEATLARWNVSAQTAPRTDLPAPRSDVLAPRPWVLAPPPIAITPLSQGPQPAALDELARLARAQGMEFEAALFAAGQPGEAPVSPVVVLQHVGAAPGRTADAGGPPARRLPVYLATGAAHRAIAHGRVLEVAGVDLARTVVMDAPITAIALSGDEHTLAVVQEDRLVVIALPAWIVIGTWALDEPARAQAISHDGRSIALGFDASLAIACARTGQLVPRPEAPAGITALAFAPDDATLAAGTTDGVVVVLDAVTGQPVSTVTRLGGGVRDLAYSSDTLLVAGGHQIQVWDLAAGRLITALATPSDPTAVAFAPRGRIAAVCKDGALRMWRTPSGEPELTLGGAHMEFAAMGLQDPDHLVTADTAGLLRTWRLLGDRPAPRMLTAAQLERISGLARRGYTMIPLDPAGFARCRESVPLPDLAPRE